MKISVNSRLQGELNLPLIYFGVTAASALPLIVLHLLHRLPPYNCPFKTITGIPCLTCGSTRSVLSLLKLDIWHAFLFNPLVFLLGVCFIAWVGYGIYMQIKGKKIHIKLSEMETKRFKYALLSLVILNWTYLIIKGI